MRITEAENNTVTTSSLEDYKGGKIIFDNYNSITDSIILYSLTDTASYTDQNWIEQADIYDNSNRDLEDKDIIAREGTLYTRPLVLQNKTTGEIGGITDITNTSYEKIWGKPRSTNFKFNFLVIATPYSNANLYNDININLELSAYVDNCYIVYSLDGIDPENNNSSAEIYKVPSDNTPKPVYIDLSYPAKPSITVKTKGVILQNNIVGDVSITGLRNNGIWGIEQIYEYKLGTLNAPLVEPMPNSIVWYANPILELMGYSH